jgi:hypothetical protein
LLVSSEGHAEMVSLWDPQKCWGGSLSVRGRTQVTFLRDFLLGDFGDLRVVWSDDQDFM